MCHPSKVLLHEHRHAVICAAHGHQALCLPKCKQSPDVRNESATRLHVQHMPRKLWAVACNSVRRTHETWGRRGFFFQHRQIFAPQIFAHSGKFSRDFRKYGKPVRIIPRMISGRSSSRQLPTRYLAKLWWVPFGGVCVNGSNCAEESGNERKHGRREFSIQ